MAKVVSQSIVFTVQKLVPNNMKIDQCTLLTDDMMENLQDFISGEIPNVVVEIAEVSEKEFQS